MIEQHGFDFSEEFFTFLPEYQAQVLRRIDAAIKDSRVIWAEGTQTFLVLDCLHEEYTQMAEKQVAQIEGLLLLKPDGPVNVSKSKQLTNELKDSKIIE